MVREEVAQAAKDGKTKLQFPTGETAMKIEGLGQRNLWEEVATGAELKPEYLEVGREILQDRRSSWIITDVLGDGKFKAVPSSYAEAWKDRAITPNVYNSHIEQFDISGKVDTSNPIYKFYEKEMGKYLKSKYNAKNITDNQGVSWYEVDIKPDMKGSIEAFGMGAIPLATQINQDKK
jgi:hypothetical protein